MDDWQVEMIQQATNAVSSREQIEWADAEKEERGHGACVRTGRNV